MAVKTINGGWTHVDYHEPKDIYEKALAGQPLPRGLSDLESELKKWHRAQDIEEVIMQHAKGDGRVRALFDSLIKIEITDEERQAAAKFSSRGLHIGGIGYVDPSRIISYYCGNCDKEYDGPPKIKVYISDETDNFGEGEIKIGSVHGECNTCEAPIISTCPVWDGQNPDPKYINVDLTGKFIRPTPESIEEELKIVTESAEKGKFDERHAKIAQSWAEMIGYDLGNRLKGLEELVPKKDLEIYERELSHTVDYLESYISGRMHGKIEIFVDRESDIADPSDEHCIEEVEKLLKYLPKIKVPEDPALREKISYIITRYKEDILEAGLKAARETITHEEEKISNLETILASLPKI